MGMISTEVAYGFGQFGSAITDSTSATLYPPRGLKIVAITALENLTFDASGGLVSELNVNNPGGISVSNFITTEGAGGHVDGEVTDIDPHTGGAASGTGGVAGVVTTAGDMLAAGVKVGMYVHTTGSMLPYNEANPFIVKAVDATTFTVTNKDSITGGNPALAPSVAVAAATANGADLPCYFYSDRGQGVGGLEMDVNDSIGKGMTIYGRWTSMNLTGGRAMVYFGV